MRRLRKLFEPITIGGVRVKNRIAMSPMGLGRATADGFVTDNMVDFYIERAKGGVGLIFVVCGYNDFCVYLPHIPALEDDKFLPGLRRMTDAIHQHGALVFAQLMNMGSSCFGTADGSPPAAPSAVKNTLTGFMPREMTSDEVKLLIEHFAEGALRAKEGGFDGVELVGNGGYLMNQFLSPLTNTRTDEYGGDFEKRMRFPVEVIQRIRDRVGTGFPISYRASGDDFMKGGNRQAEMQTIVKAFEKAGIDLVNVTAGWHQSFLPLASMDVPRGTYVYLADGIRQTVEIPVIACNRINNPFLAEQILINGQADMVGMGRPFLTDPEWPKKAAEGRYDEIRQCTACDQRCLDAVFSMSEITCTFNPAVPSCCGDGTCEGSEDGWNCEVDCGPPPFCGDDVCDPGEDQCNCPDDCGTPPATETDCADGIDNDCDGFTDGADPDCACLAKGEPCTVDSDCCSNWCHRGACK